MTLEYAKKAAIAASTKDGENGSKEVAAVKEVEERVGEVIRCLPGHLVYKSLDGMFKEWRVEKKGGRG
jgi:20S proteasome subunit alpha 6